MIKHIWSVLCSKSILDGETNNLSLIEIIEAITVMPPEEEGDTGGLFIPFEVVSLWIRDANRPAKGRMRILLETPSGTVTEPAGTLGIDLETRSRLRTRVMGSELPIRGEGLYQFHVQLRYEGEEDFQDVATIPLLVQIEQPEKQKEG